MRNIISRGIKIDTAKEEYINSVTLTLKKLLQGYVCSTTSATTTAEYLFKCNDLQLLLPIARGQF